IQIPAIGTGIEKCKNHRIKSKDKGTNKLAERAHQFRDRNVPQDSQIIIPSVSSERREYVPIGFLYSDAIISNSAQAIYDAPPWLLGVLTSRMHMTWIKAVGGKLENRYRYSKDIIYNNFPFPPISERRKQEITQC